jgi:hypothetical protein
LGLEKVHSFIADIKLGNLPKYPQGKISHLKEFPVGDEATNLLLRN